MRYAIKYVNASGESCVEYYATKKEALANLRAAALCGVAKWSENLDSDLINYIPGSMWDTAELVIIEDGKQDVMSIAEIVARNKRGMRVGCIWNGCCVCIEYEDGILNVFESKTRSSLKKFDLSTCPFELNRTYLNGSSKYWYGTK